MIWSKFIAAVIGLFALSSAALAQTPVMEYCGTDPAHSSPCGASNPASVTANAGTNLNTSSLALETGGNLAATASVLGTTSGAAVITDAAGTIQQYLRGLVKLWAAGTLGVVPSSSGATGSAPPSSASYLGANGSGATGGLLQGIRVCDQHAKYDASTSGSTKIVTGVSGRKVYICGLLVQVGATATNVKLVEGTGTNCGTGAADVTPAYQLPINGGTGFMSPFWSGLNSATNADDVCINASAANAVQADLFFAIQ